LYADIQQANASVANCAMRETRTFPLPKIVSETRVLSYPKSLFGQLTRHAPQYLLGALALACFQFAMNRIDWLGKEVVDTLFAAKGPLPWSLMCWMFIAAFAAFILRVASRWFIFNAGRDVEYELRAALLDQLHTLGSAFYRKMTAGDIMSRATNDLLQVRLLYGFGILNLANVVFAFVSALQVLLHIHVKLTLASFIMMPVIIFATRGFSKQLFLATRKNQEALSALSERLQSNLSGVRVVRSFALESYEEGRFEEANQQYLTASLTLARLRGLFGPIAGATSAAGVLVFFWYGARLLVEGSISKGDFFAFWMALGRLTWPIVALGFSISIVQRGRAGFSRLKEIFDSEPEVKDGTHTPPAHVRGSIEVRGLSFSFQAGVQAGGGRVKAPAEKLAASVPHTSAAASSSAQASEAADRGDGRAQTLCDIHFSLKEGTSVAIMGRTGSGKSTLATLLARLLPTPPGTVFLDGIDVCDLPARFVRDAIGYAQQDAFLFSSTVAQNIAFSLDNAAEGDPRITQAAQEASVSSEIERLPEQYDTVVGERGVQLSGGQKQRVALARALARGPRILVLDDPLSAVDAKTEAAILDAIDRQKRERTLVLVTNRVAAAARCDQILILDCGRIVERGTHLELLERKGIYAIFADEQRAEQAQPPLPSSAVDKPSPLPGDTNSEVQS
jgi:ATP-binding cassette, subfamily B, multidrug efflux pump